MYLGPAFNQNAVWFRTRQYACKKRNETFSFVGDEKKIKTEGQRKNSRKCHLGVCAWSFLKNV
jgi:hypothetical protein